LLQRRDQPIEQPSSDTGMSGVVRNNDGHLSSFAIDEERLRYTERSTVLLREQPARIGARLDLALDGFVVKMIDGVGRKKRR
jgi:hypothetical protein